jgi:PAS domain S-box-containing protein
MASHGAHGNRTDSQAPDKTVVPIAPLPDLRLIYETAPIGLAFLSADCRYLHINRRLTEICGLSVADHLGRSVRETVPALADAIEAIVASVMRTRQPVIGVEVAGQTKGTAERFWATYWHPVSGADGEIIGVNVAAEEITERRRAEAALHASEQQFHSLADSIPQLVWMADAGGTVFWFNRGWHDFIGASKAERDWSDYLDPAVRREAVLRWDQCRTEGQPMEMELSLRGQDGRGHPFLTRVVPVRDAAGKIHRWIGTHVDISEQHRREEHVRLLVSELSHRMKNLLAVITAVAAQTARHASDGTHYQERLTERLQALSEGHDLLVRESWQGAPLVDVIATQMKPFMENREDRIETNGPPLLLTANAAQYIGLALHELATNACKHGALSVPDGKVSIRWQYAPAANRIGLAWRERNGPRVTAPRRRGFGCSLIERIVPRALEGSGTLAFAGDGVNWTLEFSAERNLSRERPAA